MIANAKIIGSAIGRSLYILLLCFILCKDEIPRSKLRGISFIVIYLVTVGFFLDSLIFAQHSEHFTFGLIKLPVSVGRINIVINGTIRITGLGQTYGGVFGFGR